MCLWSRDELPGKVQGPIPVVKHGSEVGEFWGKLLKLRTALLQKVLDTEAQLLKHEWFGKIIIAANLKALFLP